MSISPSEEQQAVIGYGLEPLRVTAGAGTGKTFTLTQRMVSLMQRHRIAPDEVLGLTFTNKAAAELSSRIQMSLREMMPDQRTPERSADVLTYHGFSARILADCGALVGMDHGTRIITPVAAQQILRRCVLGTRFRHVDATALPSLMRDLIRLDSQLADNLRIAEDLADREPDSPVDDKRIELGMVLASFREAKHHLGVRDFGDLTRLAVQLVNHPDHQWAVDRIRSGYRCVLLDEYQDTNPAQRELLARLFRGMSVTAVGDVDQTIYEWRGASPLNFGYFPTTFTSTGGVAADTLHLSINRRSGRLIVSLANRVRAEISDSDPDDDLLAGPTAPQGAVHAAWYGNAREEAEGIASELSRLHSSGMSWSDAAILLRRNADIELVRLALEEHEIPYQVVDLGGLLTVPEIVELCAWLRLLARPEDSPALVRVLMGSSFRLGIGDLAPLARWVATQNRRTVDQPRYLMVETLDHLDDIELSATTRHCLKRFRKLYRRLLAAAQGADPSDLARTILTETDGWREIEALPGPSRVSARLNVYRFLDFADRWHPMEGVSSLTGFVDHLEMMRQDPSDTLDAARVADEDAVTLSTVHRAKGLEWEAVFLPKLYERNFPYLRGTLEDPNEHAWLVPAQLRLDAEVRNNLDPGIAKPARQAWLRARRADQEWRLAYVAVTRARGRLYLSGAWWNGSPEPLRNPSQPGPLVNLARNLPGVTTQTWVIEAPPRPRTIGFAPPQLGPDPELGANWEAALHETVRDPSWPERRARELGVADSYDQEVRDLRQQLLSLAEPSPSSGAAATTRVSVTGLVTYADCPKRFFWSEVDRLPRRFGPAARRGVEVHRRIELHNRGTVSFEDLVPDLYDRSVDDDPDQPRTRGESAWEAFRRSPYADRKPILVEAPFDLPVTEATVVRGRVDAIYEDERNGWEIVDFKSGRPSARPSARVQLEAYALAASGAAFGSPAPAALTTSFVYLGDGLEVIAERVDRSWLEDAARRVGGLVEGIEAERFPPTPSASCRSCDFLNFCDEGQSYTQSTDRVPRRDLEVPL